MKEPEIIGDDYPTYEEVINQAQKDYDKAKIHVSNDEELTEHRFGSYSHMMDTFEWWNDYLATNGPDATLNVAMEIIRYADRLRGMRLEMKPTKATAPCCEDSECNG